MVAHPHRVHYSPTKRTGYGCHAAHLKLTTPGEEVRFNRFHDQGYLPGDVIYVPFCNRGTQSKGWRKGEMGGGVLMNRSVPCLW